MMRLGCMVAVFALAGLVASGCTRTQKSDTGLVIQITIDELVIPLEMDRVTLTVDRGGTALLQRAWPLTGAGDFPIEFGLWPSDDNALPLTIEAVGWKGDEAHIRRLAMVGFDPGHIRVLPLPLHGMCRFKMCEHLLTCAATATGAACIPATIDAKNLAVYVPTGDAGMSGVDASVDGASKMDAAAIDAPVLDVSGPLVDAVADVSFDGPPTGMPDVASANRPPVISAQHAVVGVHVTVTVDLSDPDPGDHVESVRVRWNDGSDDTVVSVPPGTSQIQIDHEFSRLDTFTVDVIASDGDLDSNREFLTVVVEVPKQGLMVHWPLNGDAQDVSGNDRHGYYWINKYTGDRHNRVNSAADLANDNISDELGIVAGPQVPFGGSFTLAVWISAMPVSDSRIFGQDSWFNLYFSSTNAVSFGILDGIYPAAGQIQVGPTPHPGMPWTFYVGVVRRTGDTTSTIRLYKNGALMAEQLVNQIYNNPGTCRLYLGNLPKDFCTGTMADQFIRFPGFADDARVYDRALEPSEIKALFLEPVGS